MLARSQIESVFRQYGVIPAPGAVDRIYREQRPIWQVVRDVKWVRNYLLNNNVSSQNGHRLANPTNPTPEPTLPLDPLAPPPSRPEPEPDDLEPRFNRNTVQSMARSLFPFFPSSLLNAWVDAYIEFSGDPNLAISKVRGTSEYKAAFPGITRDDGSLRMTEGEYLSRIEGYRSRLSSFGVPTSLLNTNRIVSLIEGNVDPTEFGQRLDYVYTQVVTNLPEIRSAYAREFGLNPMSLSLASIFASAIDPELNPVEMEFRIRRAQVTGEANVAGFSIPVSESTRLAEFGLDQQAARSFYSQARTLLPTLGTLVQRHNDPDDTFDLSELSDALIFTDPDQQERIQRLFAQEESLFTTSSLFQMRDGALPGLVAD